MRIGEIKTCVEYNKEQYLKWKQKGTANNLACYVWLDNRSNFKKYGYVGKVGEHNFIWRKTKKELIDVMKKGR